MKKRILTPAILFASLVLLSCYPTGPTYVEDLDLVVTNHDVGFNFQQLGTFSMPDEVVKITGILDKGEPPEFVSDPYSDAILTAIRQNMIALGWKEVGEYTNPDVIILPSTMSSTTNIWYYDYWYWSWYYPYYWSGWYYPYPYYGGSYTTGSLFIQMTYPAGITAADNIPVIWTGVLNGLLEGSTSSVNTRINSGVNQAFQQSPYLSQ